MNNDQLAQLNSSDTPDSEFLVHYWELSNYNNNQLIGKWFDIEDVTHDEHKAEVIEWLQELTDKTGGLCEEIIIGETDGVPDRYVNEWSIDSGFFSDREAMSNIDLDDDIIEAGIKLGIPLESIADAYCEDAEGRGDEVWTNFAESVVGDDDLEGLPERLRGFFDYAKYGQELSFSHHDQDGYIFRSDY